mgnify:CR=1 FL=1
MKFRILFSILLSVSFITKAQVINDSFENWELVNDVLHPVGWSPWPVIDANVNNVYRDTALTDGQYSISLETNVFGFEGPSVQSLERFDLGHYKNISIQMSYKCVGQGDCQIFGIQKQADDWPSEMIQFFYVEATDDESIQTFSIENVNPIELYDYFSYFSFRASPIITSTGSNGHCKFIIDDFQLTCEILNLDLEERHSNSIHIYPNPSSQFLNIETDQIEPIELYNLVGQQLEVYHPHALKTTIDVSSYSPGVYLIKQNNHTQRFIKN